MPLTSAYEIHSFQARLHGWTITEDTTARLRMERGLVVVFVRYARNGAVVEAGRKGIGWIGRGHNNQRDTVSGWLSAPIKVDVGDDE